MSDEIETIQQISKTLQDAFKGINAICANFLLRKTRTSNQKREQEEAKSSKAIDASRTSQEKAPSKEKERVWKSLDKNGGADPQRNQEDWSSSNDRISKRSDRLINKPIELKAISKPTADRTPKNEIFLKNRLTIEEKVPDSDDEENKNDHDAHEHAIEIEEVARKKFATKDKKPSVKRENPQLNPNLVSHPDRPKNPPTPFFLFMSKTRKSIMDEYPELKGNDVTIVISQIWNELRPEQKVGYEEQSRSMRKAYEKRMTKYFQEHPQVMTKGEKKQQKVRQRDVEVGKGNQGLLKKLETITGNQKSGVVKVVKVVDEADDSLEEGRHEGI